VREWLKDLRRDDPLTLDLRETVIAIAQEAAEAILPSTTARSRSRKRPTTARSPRPILPRTG
jgi:hypothetical protein